MGNQKFQLGINGIIVRLLGLFFILICSVSSEQEKIFQVSVYILVIVIWSFLQELSEKNLSKKVFYILSFFSTIIFFQVNYESAIIFLIILVLEVILNIQYGIVIALAGLVILSLVELQSKYSLIYLFLGLNSMYILRSSRTYIEKLDLAMKNYDDLRERFYNNQKKHDNYIDVANQNIRMAKLEERNLIGRQMHDKVGHTIAGSLMRLEASKIILKSDIEMTEKMIDEVIVNLRDGMNDIRGIIHKITPKGDEIGVNKIKNILAQKLLNTGVELYFNTSGDLERITYELWYTIENIVTELSTNSLKYAQCTRIDVDISVLNKVLRVSFKDNGEGSKNFIKGFGLNKIEEEIIKNSGVMTINSELGFEVIVVLDI